MSALARVAVDGCGLAPGQRLVVTAPVEAAPLARALAETAWQRGAADVIAVFDDPDQLRLRLLAGPDEALDVAPADPMPDIASAGSAARITILGPRPDLLVGVAPGRILRAHAALSRAAERRRAALAGIDPAETAIPFPTRAWAALVFPRDQPDEAAARLWEALATALRLDARDPARAWQAHLAALDARAAWLGTLDLSALRLRCRGTDLTLALPPAPQWLGGTARAGDGRSFAPMLPLEALRTRCAAPGTHGHVAFTRPIALAGGVVEALRIEVDDGEIKSLAARRGGELIEAMLAASQGAARIGALALADLASPAARTGVDFLNPLLDACCAPRLTLAAASTGEAAAQAVHVDAMFGDETLAVDGIDRAGAKHALMCGGSFVR